MTTPEKQLPHHEIANTYALTLPQREVWIDQLIHPDTPLYNIGGYIDIPAAMDITRFERAFQAVVNAHDALRIVMVRGVGDSAQPLQFIAQTLPVRVPLVDLTNATDPDTAAAAYINADLAQPFELYGSALFRTALLKLGAQRFCWFITSHHVIADGWSMGLISSSLSRFYASNHDGESPGPASHAYRHFVQDDIAYRGSVRFARHREYWLEKYRDVPDPLLSHRPGGTPADLTIATSLHHAWRLPRALYDRLDALAGHVQASVLHGLLALLYVYFTRTSARDELVIGTPVLNRSNAAYKATVGMFVGISPIRLSFGVHLDFSALVRAIAGVLKADYRHQRYPLGELNRELGLPGTGRHQLFDVVLSYERDVHALKFGQVSVATTKITNGYEPTPLSVHVREGNPADDVRVHLVANAAYFRPEDLRALQHRLTSILRYVVDQPAAMVDDIPVMPAQERALVVGTFNAAVADYARDQTFHGLFEREAARVPGAVALRQAQLSMTYAELNADANRLAHCLRGLGVKTGDRVALCIRRGAEMVVGMLGILKAGAAYVPLDPDYPAQRIAYMLHDSAPAAVLVHRATADALPTGAVPVVDLDDGTWRTEREDNPCLCDTDPGDLAYVIYTSGSTGDPKGVMVEHRGLANLIAVQARHFDVGGDCKVLQSASISFDACVFELALALCQGATLCLPSPSTVLAGSALCDVVERFGITHMVVSPAVLSELPDEVDFPTVRVLFSAGSALSARLARRWSAGRRFVNAYGPTETTICATWHVCEAQADGDPPIGVPLENTRIYLLDARQRPVPIGIAAELYIAGDGVARGYLHRETLTASRFLPDPFHAQPGARMYRTGDLGRWRPDGQIEYLGRNDFQVKIRGFRIELGEIEARLAAHPGVRDAAVIARDDLPGGRGLVAYCTPASPGALDATVLRTHLQSQLPQHMMPAAFVMLGSLPLTANGKLDRNALPAPEPSPAATGSHEPPGTEHETLIAGIWQELLGVERVGRHDDFFAQGGHSLLAIHLIERMRQAGLVVDVRTLFSRPTLSALAAAVGDSADVAVPAPRIPQGCARITPDMLPLITLDPPTIDRITAAVPGGARNVQDIYPLTPLQEGILFHHLAADQGDPYVLRATFGFDGRAHLEAFAQALQCVIDRHDILRTAMAWEGLAQPAQVVWRRAVLHREETAAIPSLEDAPAQFRRGFDPHRHRMDLRQAPLMRLVSAPDASGRMAGMLLFHHMILDHEALQVVLQEMQAHLCQEAGQLAVPVPYRNLVVQTRSGASQTQHEAFFRRQLGDVEEPTLPFGVQEVRGEIEEAALELDPALSRQLRTQARRLGVNAASLHHLAWAQVVGQLSGRQDVVFGTVLSGRMQGGAARRALGMFINTLPLRIEVGGQDVRAGAMATHAALSALLAHEHAPLSLAQRCSGVPAPQPLFSALLNYIHAARPEGFFSHAAWRGMTLLGVEGRTSYPFTLSVNDQGEDFVLTAQVPASVGAARICGYMNTALAGLADALARAPHTPMHGLSVLPAGARDPFQGLPISDPAGPPPIGPAVHGTIHLRVEAHAAMTPQALAVQCDGETMTYGALNAQANQVAHRLLELGVRPDDRVAICVERGVEMIVGLLGILKAGAGYVPLDPSYPREHIAYVLGDSAPAALLVQESVLARLPELAMPLLRLDDAAREAEGFARQPVADPVVPGLGPDHLAYVIYTSGSTGQPKGVMIEHRNALRLFSSTAHWFGFRHDDVWALFHSFAFDFSVWEIWGALLHGSRLLIVPHAASRSPGDTYALLCEAGVTVLNQTPSAFRALISARAASERRHRLRLVICGGEALNPAMLRPWYGDARNAGTQLVNMYGITETTVHVTYHALSMADVERAEAGEFSPIGRCIPDLKIHVLDAHRRIAPIGVVGELHVSGAGLARGYLTRPALTAERFIGNPFRSPAGLGDDTRLYRTGDLGRWLPDGSIEYLGRNDAQVKIRGFRIELREIETKLSTCAGVREAVVIVRNDKAADAREQGPQDNKRLVAYVTAQPGAAPTATTLRAELSLLLPEHMVPTAFVTLDALPLTTNGKLDSRALPAPDQMAVVTRAYEAPQEGLEAALADIWRQVLKLDRIGRHDHFFELGGDSIRVIDLVSRVQESFAARISILAFYKDPTIRAMAATLSSEAGSEHEWLPMLAAGDPQAPGLICVPYAGAPPTVFQPLADAVQRRHASGSVYAVAMPGNQLEATFDRTLDLRDVANRCIESILQRVSGPVGVYGHCAGVVLALEIVRQLERHGREVRFVFLGGSFAAPAWVKYVPWNDPWWFRSDAALQRLIHSWGGAKESIHATGLAALLRSFRHDSQLALRHAKRQGEFTIRAPIFNVLSQDDPLTRGKEQRYLSWRRFASVVHGIVIPDGGHYFVGSRAGMVADVIAAVDRDLAALVRDEKSLTIWQERAATQTPT